MKFFYLCCFICFLLWACDKKKQEPTPNRPPAAFTVKTILDADGKTLEISWSKAIDPDGDAVTYSIVTKDTLAKNLNDTTYVISNLDYNTKVEGKVIAKDNKGLKTEVGFSAMTIKRSSSKNIISFSFHTLTPVFNATIDTVNKEITANLPFATDLTKLIPIITFSDKAIISPASGITQDFSKPITYIIMAEDGSNQTYVVKIRNAKPTKDDLKGLGNSWESIRELQLDLMEIDHTGTMWGKVQIPGTGNYSLAKYMNGKELKINSKKLPQANLNEVLEFDNTIWVASSQGIFAISEKDTLLYNSSNSVLNNNNIKALDIFDNNLYCLTETSIYKLNKGQWIKINEQKSEKFLDFKIGKDIIYLITTDYLYLYTNVFEKYRLPTSIFIPKLAIDSKGDLWIVEWNSLVKFENKIFKEYSENNVPGFPPAGLINLIIDKNDIIWISSGKQGIVTFNGNEMLYNFTTSNSKLSSDNVSDILYKDNSIYIGIFNYSLNPAKPHGVDKLKLH